METAALRLLVLPRGAAPRLGHGRLGHGGVRARRRSMRMLHCHGRLHDEQKGPQEAVLQAISEVSKTDGRLSRTRNLVMGPQQLEDWRALDDKVNSYPMERGFTAIGTGGNDFVQAMVVAVESVLDCSIPQDGVSCRPSAKGKYVSVRIGPLQVESFEQVRAIYDAMRMDNRMKYFL